MQTIWRREGLKVPQKQKPRGRLWFNDGSCVRQHKGHPKAVGAVARHLAEAAFHVLQ